MSAIRLRHLLPRPRLRLLSKRTSRRAVSPVGTCHTCGVQFMAAPDLHARVEQILAAHQRICPGGDRAGDVAMSFDWAEA